VSEAPKPSVLISGASGLLGLQAAEYFSARGWRVTGLARRPFNLSTNFDRIFLWNPSDGEIEKGALLGQSAVIHLAGAGIADQRWTSKRKQELISSRVDSTTCLIEAIKRENPQLPYFLGASAIGYYGPTSSLVSELNGVGKDFLAEVCQHWEASYSPLLELKVPLAVIRIGMVLSLRGGALPKMMAPISYGVGSALGNGEQAISWIHEQDLFSLMEFLITSHKTGVYNAVAPQVVTNRVFTKELAKVMGRPLWLPAIPEEILKLALGEMSALVLNNSAVSCKKIEDQGFSFTFPQLQKALLQLVTSSKI